MDYRTRRRGSETLLRGAGLIARLRLSALLTLRDIVDGDGQRLRHVMMPSERWHRSHHHWSWSHHRWSGFHHRWPRPHENGCSDHRLNMNGWRGVHDGRDMDGRRDVHDGRDMNGNVGKRGGHGRTRKQQQQCDGDSPHSVITPQEAPATHERTGWAPLRCPECDGTLATDQLSVKSFWPMDAAFTRFLSSRCSWSLRQPPFGEVVLKPGPPAHSSGSVVNSSG